MLLSPLDKTINEFVELFFVTCIKFVLIFRQYVLFVVELLMHLKKFNY